MKKLIILLLVITIVGCSQQDVENNSELTIYKRIDDTSFYVVMKERKDEDAIQDIINVLSNIEWESNRIKALNKDPNYQLILKENDSEIGTGEFDIWISSHGNSLEIVNRNNDKYIQLSKEESSFLFNKMTGKEL